MELIRKRRDWLIAKAAQTKANNTNTPPQSLPHSSSASPSLSSIAPPHILHGQSSYGIEGIYAGGTGSNGENGTASLAYERAGYTGRIIGKTAENPSGRCHSCGIQGAIEWRRGPDGARTLCDSCGVRTLLIHPSDFFALCLLVSYRT